MAARYLVQRPPGAPVPGVGFVRPGEIFTAPEGYLPSRTFVPVNEEARLALEKIGVKAELYVPANEAPRVEQGMTLAQLGEFQTARAAGKKESRKL